MRQFYSRVKQLNNRVNQQFKNLSPLGYALAMTMVYLFGALVMTVLTDVKIDANVWAGAFGFAVASYVAHWWTEGDWSFPIEWPNQEE